MGWRAGRAVRRSDISSPHHVPGMSGYTGTTAISLVRLPIGHVPPRTVTPRPSHETRRIGQDAQRRRKLLNLLALILPGQWCALMTIYWIRYLPPLRPFGFHEPFPDPVLFLAGCAASVAPFLLPDRYFVPRAFEGRSFYRRLGLRWFRLLAPDGDLVNRAVRKIDPSYRVVTGRDALQEHIRGTYSNERWHLSLLIAGVLTSINAFSTHQLVLGWLLTVTNVAFNLFPVLHQRYKRARLSAFAPAPVREPLPR